MRIETERQYKSVMKQIDEIMKKGEENLSEEELQELLHLSIAAENWEDDHVDRSDTRLDTKSKEDIS